MEACTRVPDISWNSNRVDSRICSTSAPEGNGGASSVDMAGQASVTVAGRRLEVAQWPGDDERRGLGLLPEGPRSGTPLGGGPHRPGGAARGGGGPVSRLGPRRPPAP